MLKTNKLTKIGISGALSVVLFMLVFIGRLDAQPTNYCDPRTPTGFTAPTYYYCYPAYYLQMYGYPAYYSTRIANVTLKSTNGGTLWSYSTNPLTFDDIPGCFKFFNQVPPIQVDIGDTYDFSVDVANVYGYTSYYCYSGTQVPYTFRMFIDWNADGDYVDAGEWINSPSSTNPINPTPSWRANRPHWNPTQSAPPWCTNQLYNYTYRVKIPDNVDATKVRMRVMGAYYYPYYEDYEYDYGYMKYYMSGKNPCLASYAYDYYSYGYSYVYAYGETEDYVVEFQLPLQGVFPSDLPPNDLLYAGEDYDGTTRILEDEDGNQYSWFFERPYVEFKTPQPAGMKVKFEIKGALPSSNVVYTGLDANGNSVIDCEGISKVTFYKSTGSASPLGNGVMKINNGGEYQVWITLYKPNGQEKTLIKKFTVSWLNDLSVAEINSPLNNEAPRYYKYPPDVPVPLTATFQNVGLKNITKFRAYARIYSSEGVLIQTYFKDFDTSKPEYNVLTPKSKIMIDFGAYSYSELDKYKLIIEGELLSANDMEAFNDFLPRENDPLHIFEIQAETEIGAVDIIIPNEGSTIYAGRAIEPTGMIQNFGVGDASGITCTMEFENLTTGTKFIKTVDVPDVPSGFYNKRTAIFDGFVLEEPGDWKVTFTVAVSGDYVLDNNSVTEYFKVIGGLKDVVKVGIGQDYPNLNTFMDALYNQGMSGNLTVLLTDAEYNLYSPSPESPAWDLSSYINGLGYDAVSKTTRYLTFKPSPQRATQKSSVKINLHAQSGKGVYFGQNRFPSNPNAPVYFAPTYDIKKKFMNTPGCIVFDGGANKSLKFILNSFSSIQGQAFFLGRGSHDIQIKNLVIENGTPKIASKTSLPRMIYNTADGWKFNKDSLELVEGNQGFSAGIANRGTLTADIFESNVLYIDTIPNSNNTFAGNEIYGFGYGITSMGIGPLINPRSLMIERFYNLNNKITGNLIHDVERSGIFLGFEEDAEISSNRIYNVVSSVNDQSYGIEAGAYPSTTGYGYNNVGLQVFGNEISGLNDSKEVAAIKLLQNGQQYPNPLGGWIFFPDTDEKFSVYNNMIYGITTSDKAAGRFGIYALTDRDADVFTPKYPNYFARGMFIANNTVIIPDDGINNIGNQAGIAVMNFNGVKLFNNAIAITDNQVDNSNSQFDAAIAFLGSFPGATTFESDYNAFWLGNNQNLSHYRFYEVDGDSQVLEAGYNNEYKSLLQWQMWTKNDLNSVTGFNFVNDYFMTTQLPQYNRIKQPYPLGSVLNNRGLAIEEVIADIDGNVRGDGGYRYDIGACEFNGNMYLRDLQPLLISAPGNYRQTAPRTYSEAEYIMTNAPVEVTTRIFNPGSMLTVDAKMDLTIEVENPDGSYEPVIMTTATVNRIESNEFQDLSFNLADGMGEDFAPYSYYDWEIEGKNYAVPTQFESMKENVTPVYRITVTAENDLFNNNNTTVKYVRFYVKKSNGYNIMVNAPSDLTPMPSNPNVNEVARRLNYEYLIAGLKDIGLEKIAADSRFDFDYFNRDAWENRALDYTMYRTMFWSEGDNDVATEGFDRYEMSALNDFIQNGYGDSKVNFIMASQEYVRNNTNNNIGTFLTNIFRVNDKTPSNPMGAGGSYDGYNVKGQGIARNFITPVVSTGYPNDDAPRPGLFNIVNLNDGLAQIGYTYETLGAWAPTPAQNTDKIMAVATTTQLYNAVYFGIDWRHFQDLQTPMRGVLDFAEQNDGKILPINLLSFNAEQAASRVDINWTTASEFNSAYFQVEKANVKSESVGEFAKIATVDAAGTSGDIKNYGPISDKDVLFGATYSYRLKMVDKDGSYSYSDNKLVTINGSDGTVWMSEVTPRPATSVVKVDLQMSNSMSVDLSVFDLNGRKVLNVLNGSTTSRELSINVSTLAAGSYTLVLSSGDVYITRTFTVVR